MKILIVKTSALGDIVQAFPVIAYLKVCYPEAIIDWVVEKPFAALLQTHPDINQVIVIDSKKWRHSIFSTQSWKEIVHCRKQIQNKVYDHVLDLQGNTKSALVTLQARSKHKVGFGHGYVAERPNTWVTHQHVIPEKGKNIREDYLSLAREAIQGPSIPLHELPAIQLKHQTIAPQWEPGINALIFPGSAWPNKQLKEKTLADLLQALNAKGFKLHFGWGSHDEFALVQKLQKNLPEATILARYSLPDLQYIMSCSDVIICMDSLPLHLAATTKTPTYSFFGPSLGQKYAPIGHRHGTFQGSCPYHVTFEKRCPKLRTCPTGACTHDLLPEVLINAFMFWWQTQKEAS